MSTLDITSRNKQEQEKLRRGLAELSTIDLRHMLRDGVDQAKVVETQQKLADVVAQDSKERKSNARFGMLLDNSLRKTIGIGLAKFRCEHP